MSNSDERHLRSLLFDTADAKMIRSALSVGRTTARMSRGDQANMDEYTRLIKIMETHLPECAAIWDDLVWGRLIRASREAVAVRVYAISPTWFRSVDKENLRVEVEMPEGTLTFHPKYYVRDETEHRIAMLRKLAEYLPEQVRMDVKVTLIEDEASG